MLLGAMCGVIISLPLGLWETVVPAALVFPILLWLAARWQPVFSAAGGVTVSMSVALTAIYGLGEVWRPGASQSAPESMQTEAVILVVAFGTAVLAALFAEKTESEARLASTTNTMLRSSRITLASFRSDVAARARQWALSLHAVMASTFHEIKQHLSAIALNGAATGNFPQSAPPDLAEVQSALDDVINDSYRTGQILDNLHQLFGREKHENEPIDINDLALSSLQILRRELTDHGIARLSIWPRNCPWSWDRKLSYRKLLNLIYNAIEAMAAINTDD